jgi:hypothetical protein
MGLGGIRARVGGDGRKVRNFTDQIALAKWQEKWLRIQRLLFVLVFKRIDYFLFLVQPVNVYP